MRPKLVNEFGLQKTYEYRGFVIKSLFRRRTNSFSYFTVLDDGATLQADRLVTDNRTRGFGKSIAEVIDEYIAKNPNRTPSAA